MQRSVVLVLLSLLAVTVYSQTLEPGHCLAGQVDSNTPHPQSQYTPVTYSFSPAAYKGISNGATLLFMSFNIQSNYGFFCNQILSNQTAFMASVAPDFLGLQETDIDIDIRCNCNQPQAVADAVGHTAYFMQMFPWRTGRYGDTTAVGYTVEILTYLYFNLPTQPDLEQRGALAHLVTPPALNGYKLWYINTHLEQSSLDARNAQIVQLIEWVKNTLFVQQPTALVVITGDFYTVPGDTSYEAMASYFSNSWAVFSGSSAGGFTHPANFATERDDHIWFKEPAGGNIKVTINNFTIVDSLLSDHKPILAQLSFTTTGAPGTTGASTVTPTSGVTPATTGATPATTAGTTSAATSTAPTSGVTTGVTPDTTGVTPGTTGVTPATSGVTPATTGVTPGTTGVTPATTGVTPATTGVTPATTGVTPATTGVTPATTGVTPATSGVTPGTTGTTPDTTGTTPTTAGATSATPSSTSAASGTSAATSSTPGSTSGAADSTSTPTSNGQTSSSPPTTQGPATTSSASGTSTSTPSTSSTSSGPTSDVPAPFPPTTNQLATSGTNHLSAATILLVVSAVLALSF